MNQSASISQIILVDSSEDDTVDIAKRAGGHSVDIVHGNFSVGMARYIAVQRSTSEFVFFVDADAVLTSEVLGALLKKIQQLNVQVLAPRIRNPLSKHPDAWHAGVGEVSFVPFTAVLIRRSSILGISDEYKSLSAGEDALICSRIRQNGGEIIIDDEVVVDHCYDLSLKALMKKGWWYGTGDALLWLNSPELSFISRGIILSRSGFFITQLLLTVLFIYLNHPIFIGLIFVSYAAIYCAIYVNKFGIRSGMYRAGIEALRSPVWAAATCYTLLRKLLK